LREELDHSVAVRLESFFSEPFYRGINGQLFSQFWDGNFPVIYFHHLYLSEALGNQFVIFATSKYRPLLEYIAFDGYQTKVLQERLGTRSRTLAPKSGDSIDFDQAFILVLFPVTLLYRLKRDKPLSLKVISLLAGWKFEVEGSKRHLYAGFVPKTGSQAVRVRSPNPLKVVFVSM